MKQQISIFLSKIKKEHVWLIILIGLVIIDLILFNLKYNSEALAKIELISLIGFPNAKQYNSTTLLIYIYETILVLYYVYSYYVYELDNAFETTVLRENEKRWVKNKFVISSLFAIFLSLIYTSTIYMFFKDQVLFDIRYFLYPMTYNLITTYLLITTTNFFKKKNFLSYLILILISIMIYFYFNIYVSLLIIVVLMIINIRLFHFKKYYNNNYS